MDFWAKNSAASEDVPNTTGKFVAASAVEEFKMQDLSI